MQGVQGGTGGQQEGGQDCSGAEAAVVAQADLGLEQVAGVGMHVFAVQGILGVAHGRLLSGKADRPTRPRPTGRQDDVA